MIKAVIFDLDGTTLNTLKDLQVAINKVMKDLNLPLQSLDQVRLHTGSGTKMMIKRSLPKDADEQYLSKAVELFVRYYGQNYFEFSHPYEGVKELIDNLLNRGIKVGINSNKIHEYCKHLIQINFPGINESFILGKREGYPTKPNPINNIDLINRMGVQNNEVLYVGDSEIDIQTAHNSNLKCVTVSWGFRAKEALQLETPDYVIDSADELLNIINEINKKEAQC